MTNRSGLIPILGASSSGSGCLWFGGVPQTCERRHPLEICLDEAVVGEAVGVLRLLNGIADLTVRSTDQIELGDTEGDVQEVTTQHPEGWTKAAVPSLSTLQEIASYSRAAYPDRSKDDLFAAFRRATAAGALGCRLFVTQDQACTCALGRPRSSLVPPASSSTRRRRPSTAWGRIT